MCSPGCLQKVAETISRRGVFKAAGTVAIAAAASSLASQEVPAARAGFSRVIDLTHPLWPEFPTYSGRKQLKIDVVSTFGKTGFNMKLWHLIEHTGTHLDAPLHFTENGPDASAIPAETLVAPLCIIDIAQRAAENPDAQVTPEDLKKWEGKNGQLPDGGAVAMNSGWDQHVRSDKFRNADSSGVMHFPGFHPETAAALLERKVVGIIVDTLSLDYGMAKEFATHYRWLSAGRWGLEAAANLGQLPENGATVVVGGPKIEGSTGGPSRVFALL